VSDWLQRTGQGWKLKLGMAWIVAGILLLIVVIVAGASSVAGFVAAIAVSASGFVWTALAFRCPACRKRAVFLAMLHEPGHQWLPRIMSADRCPVCGDPAAPRT